jgi:YD repeat-containing protein
MKKMIIIILAVFGWVFNLTGQSHKIPSSLELDFFRRGISPQVALMNQYGDYPVDLQNGLVDVSIPLYTLSTSSGPAMPLQLKFHASGLRSDEREGLLGIRWALAGGGHVSRIIKGYADEFYPFDNQVSNPNYTPDFYTLFGTTGNKQLAGSTEPGNNSHFTSGWNSATGIHYPAGSYKDTEHDIFSYSLPSGKSGKFILKDVNGSKTACLMPYEPLTVLVNKVGKHFSAVTIIDEDGVIYRFGEKRAPNTSGYTDSDKNGWITTWHLSSILYPNSGETVEIDYVRSGRTPEAEMKSLVVSDRLHDYTTFTPEQEGGYVSPLYALAGNILTSPNNNDGYFRQDEHFEFTAEYSPYYISSIKLQSGSSPVCKVDFSYSNETTTSGNLKWLKEMRVKDGQMNTVKTIGFIPKNNWSGHLKLLDKVEFTDGGNPAKKETYTFGYYDSSSVPACRYLSLDSDWWGFYSQGGGWFQEISQFSISVPNGAGSVTVWKTLPGGDKTPRLESLKTGMLQKITYPSGGSTEFEYQVNASGSGSWSGSGLRISKLKKTTGSGNPEIKRYEYGRGYLSTKLSPPGSREARQNILSEVEVDCYATVNYPSGMGYEVGTGRYIQRTYQNTFPSQYTDFRSNIVCYGEVTEYIENASGANSGKTIYKYNVLLPGLDLYQSLNGSEFRGDTNSEFPHVSPKDFWRGNQLQSMAIYDAGNRKVKEFIYSYDTYRKESVYDMPVYRYRQPLIGLFSSWTQVGRDEQEILMIHPYGGCSDCLEKAFAFVCQEYTSGAEKLSRVTENTYQGDGTMVSLVKEYVYEPDHLMLQQEKTTNSDGKVTGATYKYPFQYATIPYTTMVAATKNILSPVIEQQQYVGNNWLQTVKTDYKNWGNNIFAPEFVKYQTSSQATAETRLTYHNYSSNGKPLYISKDNAEKVVYLWGYNYQYPIAEIRGVDFSTVTGIISSSSLETIAAKTEPSSADLATINNLRTAIPGALVTTYTYKPMVGMKSMKDPRGVETVYDYDPFGRLGRVTQAGKVINEYEYKYKN